MTGGSFLGFGLYGSLLRHLSLITLVQNSILTTWGKQTSGKCVRWV